jgi:hypothetical protein
MAVPSAHSNHSEGERLASQPTKRSQLLVTQYKSVSVLTNKLSKKACSVHALSLSLLVNQSTGDSLRVARTGKNVLEQMFPPSDSYEPEVNTDSPI